MFDDDILLGCPHIWRHEDFVSDVDTVQYCTLQCSCSIIERMTCKARQHWRECELSLLYYVIQTSRWRAYSIWIPHTTVYIYCAVYRKRRLEWGQAELTSLGKKCSTVYTHHSDTIYTLNNVNDSALSCWPRRRSEALQRWGQDSLHTCIDNALCHMSHITWLMRLCSAWTCPHLLSHTAPAC